MAEDLVLVVEDDAAERALIAEVLEQELGVHTAIAADGLSALRQVWRLLPTLVVLDTCSPGVDGLEVVRRLKADPYFRRIPIIAMSLQPDESDKAIAYGCDGCLTKPCDATAVARSVRPFLLAQPPERYPKPPTC